MPPFDLLPSGIWNQEHFQISLSFIYADILAFHGRVYKLLRGPSWRILFKAQWKNLESNFENILDDIAHHRQFLMQRVTRIENNEMLIKQQQMVNREFWSRASISWLKARSVKTGVTTAEDKDPCERVLANPLFKTWKDDVHGEPVLWVKDVSGNFPHDRTRDFC